jgi:hypothetical protein
MYHLHLDVAVHVMKQDACLASLALVRRSMYFVAVHVSFTLGRSRTHASHRLHLYVELQSTYIAGRST